MKTRFLLILVAFVSWSVACNWWYLCKIKNLCNEGSAPIYSSLGLSDASPARPEAMAEPAEVSPDAPEEMEAVNTDDPEVSPDPESPSGPARTPIPAREYSVHFDLASSRIDQKNEFEPILSDIKSRVDQDMLDKIILTGHTCDLGNGDFNYRLGLERATAVKRELTGVGVPEGKIEISSGGEGSPLNNNASEIDRIQNRRTEITIK